MLGSPCNPCCGCTPAKAYNLWQDLRAKTVTMTVTGGTLPRRDPATFASNPYCHGQRSKPDSSGTPPPSAWLTNDPLIYVNSLEDALTTGLDVNGTKRFNGGHQYWEGHAAYSFGQQVLALDADPAHTSWSSETNTGTVRFHLTDFRAFYRIDLTLHGRAAQHANERSYGGCALSASYAVQAFYNWTFDGEMSGSLFDVSFVEFPHRDWAGVQTEDMAMATVSPQYYEKRSGNQRFLYLPTYSLRSYSGWWDYARKPSSLPWDETIDLESFGALTPASEHLFSAVDSPQVESVTSQWLAHTDDGNWAAGLSVVDGHYYNFSFPGQSGYFPVITSYSPASQSYQPVLAAGTAFPLSIACDIA